MRRQSLALIVLSLACAAIPSASGKTSLSAQQILSKTAENYKEVTGYTVSGSVSTHMVVNDQTSDLANSLVVAYGGPGRSRFEASTGTDRMLFVNSADSVFTYSSAFAQYVIQARTAAAAAVGGLPAIDPSAPHPFSGYSRLADHVTQATLVREDTATVNGKTVATFVVDVSYDSTVVPQSAQTKPKRLVIDQKTFLVVADETSIERVHPQLEKPILIEQAARFTNIRWNAAPPDSLFAFRAPEGTTRVAQLGPAPSQQDAEGEMTGQPAGDFTLPDLAGVKRALSSHKGKVVLLDFWATWCGPCRREMPIIDALHARYAKKGLVVYGVNCSESQSKAKAFVQKYGYNFPQLLDKDGSVQTAYQITAIPTVFIVDKEGTIRAHLVGGRSEAELVAALERAGLDIGP